MSMHEIEDLVEQSIRAIDKSAMEKSAKRDTYFSLYNFQGQFDCSYTNFRVADILIKNEFTFFFDIESHPDYLINKEYFDSLDKSEMVTLEGGGYYGDITRGARAPVYKLYFDAGTAIWEKFVEAGLITELGAVKPRGKNLYRIMLEAGLVGNTELKAMWFIFMPYLEMLAEETEEAVTLALKKLYHTKDVYIQAADGQYGNYLFESVSQMRQSNFGEFSIEWFKPFYEWEKDNSPLDRKIANLQNKFGQQKYLEVILETEKYLLVSKSEEILLLNIMAQVAACQELSETEKVKTKVEKIVIWLDKIINDRPQRAVLFLQQKGLCQLLIKSPEQAEKTFYQCLAIEPDFLPARKMIEAINL